MSARSGSEASLLNRGDPVVLAGDLPDNTWPDPGITDTYLNLLDDLVRQSTHIHAVNALPVQVRFTVVTTPHHNPNASLL